MRVVQNKGPCQCPLAPACSRGRGPFHEVRRRKHHIIYLQGEPAAQVYFVQHGSVSLRRMSTEDRGLGPIRTLRHKGSFFGIEALVDECYQTSAQAETPLVLCVSNLEDLTNWIGPRTTPAFRVLEAMLRTGCDDMLPRTSPDGTAVERVARWLIDSDDIALSPQIERRGMADLLGMRPETLSRALRSLADAGFIKTSRSSLLVVDTAGLKRLSARPAVRPRRQEDRRKRDQERDEG